MFLSAIGSVAIAIGGLVLTCIVGIVQGNGIGGIALGDQDEIGSWWWWWWKEFRRRSGLEIIVIVIAWRRNDLNLVVVWTIVAVIWAIIIPSVRALIPSMNAVTVSFLSNI